MDKILNYATAIAILVALITGIICTLIIVIDCHKHSKLLQKIIRSEEYEGSIRKRD